MRSEGAVALCQTIAIRRAIQDADIVDRSVPSNLTLPDSGERAPHNVRTRVVFPEPLGPSMACITPAWNDTETSLRIL